MNLYQEEYRPQFHYSPKENWMNDPNGLVFYEGEYHLFYQYHPHSSVWGPMHWGHAVSKDMVHWEELSIALEPDGNGAIFSGSAVVDWADTTGFFKGKTGIVLIFTHADMANNLQRQSLAYSLDNGRTWTKYEGNPVLKDESSLDFRDPKVFWHKETSRWVMLVASGDTVSIYTSSNMKEWNFASRFGESDGSHDGVWECPDLFILPVYGSDNEQKWVLIVSIGDRPEYAEGSRTQYFIGSFDGTYFHNSHSTDTVLWLDYGRDNYAGVSWSDIPEEDGRRIYMGWMSNWRYAQVTPTNPWRSAMTIPRELYLKRTKQDVVRLFQQPIKELASLHNKSFSWANILIDGAKTVLENELNDTMEIRVEFEIGTAEDFGLMIHGTIIGYNVREKELYINRKDPDKIFHADFAMKHGCNLEAENKCIQLHIFVDKSSIEVFANYGLVAITDQVFPKMEESTPFEIFASKGEVKIRHLEVNGLDSIWL